MREIKEQDPLARFYTHSNVSRLLVDVMTVSDPTTIIDLGAGGGALTTAARRKWEFANIFTVDLDEEVTFDLRTRTLDGGFHRHLHADALDYCLPKLLGVTPGSVDAAICNPPYVRPVWRPIYAELLEAAGLSGTFAAIRDVTADVLFLAQNLRLLRDGGQAGMVVPDGLIAGHKYSNLRRQLLQNHGVSCVIQLPRQAFRGADAQAHIIVLNKAKSPQSTETIRLLQLSANGQLSHPIDISPDDAAHRMDYRYYDGTRRPSEIGSSVATTLASIRADIVRGKLSSRDARNFVYPVFHTTSFPPHERCSDFSIPHSMCVDLSRNLFSREVTAGPGDILLARVGRNLQQKICLVAAGQVVISDCVYRLRVPDTMRENVMENLLSDRGQSWLKANSHGVGAQQIAKSDLLNFPLLLPPV